jgi:hypothetical protein
MAKPCKTAAGKSWKRSSVPPTSGRKSSIPRPHKGLRTCPSGRGSAENAGP